jgi:hypothetical protein
MGNMGAPFLTCGRMLAAPTQSIPRWCRFPVRAASCSGLPMPASPLDAKIHGRTSPLAVRMRLTAQNLHIENWRSVMRFEDQSAVLEWLPVDMKPARYHQPI